MTPLSFQNLRSANSERTALWGVAPDHATELLFRSNELGGEAGEAQNEVKKLARHMLGMRGGNEFELARAKLATELADVVICADRVAQFANIDLGAAVVDKFNATSDKHGFPVHIKLPDANARAALVARVEERIGCLAPDCLDQVLLRDVLAALKADSLA